jgi:hypothetical protein
VLTMQENALYAEVLKPSWSKLLACLLLVFCATCGEAELEPVISDSGLVVEPLHLQLDQVRFGDKGSGVFHIQNTSDEPKNLIRIGPATCSCTTLTLRLPDRPNFEPRQLRGHTLDIELQPGEKAELEVLFDTARNRRPVSRRIDAFALMVEGARGINLQYSVDVWVPFWMEPWSLDLGRVGATAKASGFASIKAHDEKVFDLIVPSEVDGWLINTKQIEGAQALSFNIEFQAPDELPLGPFHVSIPVRVDLANSPTLSLQVMGVAVPDVDWTPRKLVMRPNADGSSQQTVSLNTTSATAEVYLKIAALSGLPEGLVKVEWEVIAEGKSYQVKLTVAEPPTERLEGELTLILDSEDTPQVRIPVVVLPRP